MPPLLPEYLSQPLQIVIESPTTDWSAVVASGLFTLTGAAIGAWLGGRQGYKSALKAGQRINQQSKIEECMLLALNIQALVSENDIQTDPVGEPANKLGITDNLFDEDALKRFDEAVGRLSTLVNLHSFKCSSVAGELAKSAFYISDLTKRLLRYSRMKQDFNDAAEMKQLRQRLLQQMNTLIARFQASLKEEL